MEATSVLIDQVLVSRVTVDRDESDSYRVRSVEFDLPSGRGVTPDAARDDFMDHVHAELSGDTHLLDDEREEELRGRVLLALYEHAPS